MVVTSFYRAIPHSHICKKEEKKESIGSAPHSVYYPNKDLPTH